MICILLSFFAISQEASKKDDSSVVLPFIKLDSLGVNPLNRQEKIIFQKNSAERMVKEFKEAPVYIVVYKENENKKIESKYEQIGMASCVFVSDNWINASIKVAKPIPQDYVLRARTISNQNRFNNNILEVQSAAIVEFYLKPKETAVEFK